MTIRQRGRANARYCWKDDLLSIQQGTTAADRKAAKKAADKAKRQAKRDAKRMRGAEKAVSPEATTDERTL